MNGVCVFFDLGDGLLKVLFQLAEVELGHKQKTMLQACVRFHTVFTVYRVSNALLTTLRLEALGETQEGMKI